MFLKVRHRQKTARKSRKLDADRFLSEFFVRIATARPSSRIARDKGRLYHNRSINHGHCSRLVTYLVANRTDGVPTRRQWPRVRNSSSGPRASRNRHPPDFRPGRNCAQISKIRAGPLTARDGIINQFRIVGGSDSAIGTVSNCT